jgi:hypothetical protein
MAVGYHVTKTAGTLAGKPVLGVHVVRDEGVRCLFENAVLLERGGIAVEWLNH